VVPFDRLGMISYYCPIVTLSLRRKFCEIRLALETRVRVHWRSSEPTGIDPPPM